VSRSDATTSSCNRPPANRRDRVGSTPRPRLRKNGSSKTAGTPVRDRSRHGGRRAIGSGASIVGPRAVGIRRGQPACAIACTTRASWLPYQWRLADSTRKRRPALRRSRRHRPPHRLPRHAGLPLAVRRADTTSRSPPAWKNKELLQFLLTGWSLSLAPTNVLLGNPAALKRAFESGGASLVLVLRSYLH
jgi:polyhydroxyalkanoate synthase